ncbi:MAG TPA: lipid-binding SYLF domain-containing protein [Steroidobacteraceae bacterium]|nr:lipid-binding SYLF domain-containing protein [Steroidobacteraceae bacterium]
MKGPLKFLVALLAGLLLPATAALANEYTDTVRLFENAGQSAAYFHDSYGYAVFPTIGKGGFVVGGAHGDGRVYVGGRYIGRTEMTQVSVGFQAGAQAYSQIIFFQDKRALDEFTSGEFAFDAGVSAVAITAAASGSVGTEGATGGASGGKKDALTAGGYYKGVAVFTIVKGGAMYQATVAGQKFSYKPRHSAEAAEAG